MKTAAQFSISTDDDFIFAQLVAMHHVFDVAVDIHEREDSGGGVLCMEWLPVAIESLGNAGADVWIDSADGMGNEEFIPHTKSMIRNLQKLAAELQEHLNAIQAKADSAA